MGLPEFSSRQGAACSDAWIVYDEQYVRKIRDVSRHTKIGKWLCKTDGIVSGTRHGPLKVAQRELQAPRRGHVIFSHSSMKPPSVSRTVSLADVNFQRYSISDPRCSLTYPR